MQFGIEVKECHWIQDRQRWRIQLYDQANDLIFFHECIVLFSAAGVLVYPRELDIPGAENFDGTIVHSARWKSNIDLQNRSVVVIGNGCTAAQIVPAIVNKVKKLTQIFRSKHWIFEQLDAEYPEWMKWTFRYVPFALRLHRFLIFWGAEQDFKLFPDTPVAEKLRAQRKLEVENHMRATAPKKWHELLIPDFEVGCKRRIYDPGYLKSLHSDKITLSDAKPVEIEKNGIRTADGFVEAEVITVDCNTGLAQFCTPQLSSMLNLKWAKTNLGRSRPSSRSSTPNQTSPTMAPAGELIV